MHNFFYIAIRTIPFWCIPIGLALLATGLKVKGKKWMIIPAVLMIVGSVLFLYHNGQFSAVPFVHEMLNSTRELPTPSGDL